MSKIKYLDFANYVEENRQSLIDHCIDNGKNVDSNQSLEQIVQINNTINLDAESTERPMRKVFNYDGTLLESSVINIGDKVYLPDYEPPIYDDRLEFDRWINTTNQTTAKYDYSIAPIMRVKEQIDLDGTLVRPTLIDISLNDPTQLSPTIRYSYGTALTRTAYIDWGDGTVDELTNSNSSKQHTYSQTGNYTIKMYSKSTSFTPYSPYSNESPFGNYANCVIRVYIGSISYIQSGAFNLCQLMEIMIIPSTVKIIESYVAENTYSLKFISLPKLDSSSYYGFQYSGFENIIMESGSVFSNYLFEDCYSLKSFIIPDDANFLNYSSIFGYNYALEKIVFPNDYTNYNISHGFCRSVSIRYLNLSKMTAIPDNLCNSCYNLSNVTLSASLLQIRYSAFASCYSLKTIKLPESLNEIGDSAFKYCYTLQNIKLPNNLKTLGIECFTNCYNLLEMIIPDSVTSIGSNCFTSCSLLKTLVLPNNWSKNIDFIQYCNALSNESYISMGKRIANLTNQTASIITFNNLQKARCDLIKVNAETGDEDENGISLTQFIQNKNWTITISG